MNFQLFITLTLVHGVAWAAVIRLVVAGRWNISFRHVLIAAMAIRAALLPFAPPESDDIYRYLWEGYVQTRGPAGFATPFLYAPDDPALAALRDSYHALINFPAIAAVYPPATQLVFALLTIAGRSLIVMKLGMTALEVSCAFALRRIARARGITWDPAIIWLTAPLPLLEFARNGHADIIGVTAMLWGLALLIESDAGPVARSWLASGEVIGAALLGLAAAAKFLPIVIWPFFFRANWKRWTVAIAAALVVTLPYLPAGAALGGALSNYAQRWEFNGSFFGVARWVIAKLNWRLSLSVDAQTIDYDADALARLISWGTVVAVFGIAAWATIRGLPHALKRRDAERAALLIFPAFFLTAPTVHPWYLVWVLPVAILQLHGPLLLWTVTVFFAYAVLPDWRAHHVWNLPAWALWVEYAPVYGWMIFELIRSASRRHTSKNDSVA